MLFLYISETYFKDFLILSLPFLKKPFYNFSLKILIITTGKADKAMHYYKELVSKKLVPDVITFTCLLHALGNAGKFAETEAVLRIMKEAKITPNIITLSALLSSYATYNRINDVMRVYNKIKSLNMTLNSKLFTMVIGALYVLYFSRNFPDLKIEQNLNCMIK